MNFPPAAALTFARKLQSSSETAVAMSPSKKLGRGLLRYIGRHRRVVPAAILEEQMHILTVEECKEVRVGKEGSGWGERKIPPGT